MYHNLLRNILAFSCSCNDDMINTILWNHQALFFFRMREYLLLGKDGDNLKKILNPKLGNLFPPCSFVNLFMPVVYEDIQNIFLITFLVNIPYFRAYRTHFFT